MLEAGSPSGCRKGWFWEASSWFADSCVCAGSSYGLISVGTHWGRWGEKALVSGLLLMRTPALLDEDPTLVTSFNLYYLLIGPTYKSHGGLGLPRGSLEVLGQPLLAASSGSELTVCQSLKNCLESRALGGNVMLAKPETVVL